MEKNKTIMKLCYLQTAFYIVFLTALITRHRRGISQKTFAFLIILSLVGCAVSLTLGDYLRNMIRSSGFDVAGVHDKKSLEKKLQQLQNADDTLNVGVMMFDLNDLKYVNDTYGHEKGDEFIQSFSYCLTRILDSDSFLARYGGDEFIIIQQNTSEASLRQMARKLNSLVQEYNSRTTLPLSYAIGYEVSYQNHYFMMQDLINAADQKMYQDKAHKKIAANKKFSSRSVCAGTAIPTISSETLSEKIRQIQSNTGNTHSLALISTDVENFHFINDKYGYSLGNEILNMVYEEIAGAPFTIFTTRFFSDVFISIADISDLTNDAFLSEIQALDRKICKRMRNTFHVNFFRTNSGICLVPDADTTPETILSCANVARRLSKKMLSPCCIYSDEIDRQEKMQAEILHSFHQALKNEEFQIYFQPKVTPQNGNISSAEVLVRWIRDQKMLWSPAVYIPLFEQNGFVIRLDYYVYEKTFRWLQESVEFLPENFRLSLNVSPLHFEEPENFVKKICELIHTYQVDTSRLTFEITESTYVNNTEAVNQVIRRLKQLNIQISMDDFGSGYSSLNTLKDLLFNEVKIDRKSWGIL